MRFKKSLNKKKRNKIKKKSHTLSKKKKQKKYIYKPNLVGLTICAGIGRSFNAISSGGGDGSNTSVGRNRNCNNRGSSSNSHSNQSNCTNNSNHNQQGSTHAGFQQTTLTLPLATALTRTATIKSQFLGNISY